MTEVTQRVRLAMFPLGTVLFPTALLPLHVFEDRYRRMVADCLAEGVGFGVVLIARGSEVGGGDVRLAIGTEARIERAHQLPDGQWVLVAFGIRRITVEEWFPEHHYPEALVRVLSDSARTPSKEKLASATRAVRSALALLSELGHDQPGGNSIAMGNPARPDTLAWQLCTLAPLGVLDRQTLLEIDDSNERLVRLTELTTEAIEDLHRILAQGGPLP